MPQRPRPQPERNCVACRSKRPKRVLIRLVMDTAGRLAVDARGRAPGRGAYLCPDPACWQRAAAGRPLGQALRADLDDADRTLLRAGPPLDPVPAHAAQAASAARYASAGKTTR